jgi:hypothetical protein
MIMASRFFSAGFFGDHKPAFQPGKPVFVLLLFLFLSPPSSLLFSQSMLVSEALTIRNDFGYELIGRLRDRVLLFRDKYDDFEVQAYDPQLRLSWTKEVEGIDRRGVQILEVIGGKNDFSILYKVRRRAHAVMRLHKYDPGANLIDSMIVKDYGERVFDPPSLQVVRSEDRNCFAVVNTANDKQLEVVCFRVDKMQVLWDKTVQLDDDYLAIRLQDMVVTNNGDFYLIGENNNRRNRLEDHEFEILQVGAATEKVIRVPAREFMTNASKFTYDNLHNRLVGAGLYADKTRDRANGTFLLTVAGATATPMLRFEPFDEKFLAVLRRKDAEEANKGIDDATVRELILRQDGGVVLVAERYREIQRGAAAGRGFFREGMRMVVDFFYDDMFAVGMHPDGQIHWNTVLHKKQYSQDDEGTFSSFMLLRNADKVRFLFNDEIKYENTCSEYILSPVGSFDRNSLISTFGQNLRLRFRDGLQLSSNECLVPSEARSKLRLVLLRF